MAFFFLMGRISVRPGLMNKADSRWLTDHLFTNGFRLDQDVLVVYDDLRRWSFAFWLNEFTAGTSCLLSLDQSFNMLTWLFSQLHTLSLSCWVYIKKKKLLKVVAKTGKLVTGGVVMSVQAGSQTHTNTGEPGGVHRSDTAVLFCRVGTIYGLHHCSQWRLVTLHTRLHWCCVKGESCTNQDSL